MKLHTYYRSSAAFRVRIALNFKGLEYESLSWQLKDNAQRSAAYLKVNPLGLVPVLEDDGHVIQQSLAIVEYLDERYPDPPLLPAEQHERALARSFALDVACEIHPLNNLRVLGYLKKNHAFTDEAVSQWVRHWIEEGLRAIEVRAQQTSKNRTCLVGSAISIADVCLVPQMFNARRFNCRTDDLPTLCAIDEHLRAHPAFAAAAPAAQPDFEPN